MQNPIVSIVIPVYRTEDFLEECVESVLNQTYTNLEIILVNDGSPDKSPEICERLRMQHTNIFVIHKKNQGIGMARNSGIEKARGKYIMFLDSDDKLDGEDAVALLVRKAQEKDADITMGSFRRFNKSFVSEKNWHHLREGEYTRTADFRFKGFYQYGHLAYDWGKLYKLDFLKKYELVCSAYSFVEDKAHNMRCCFWDPKYAFIDESIVLYRINEKSVTFKYKKNMEEVWVSIAKDFMQYQREHGKGGYMDDLAAFHIFFGAFFLVKQELQQNQTGWWDARRTLKYYGKDPFVRSAMRALANGKFVRKIDSIAWKIVIWIGAVLFRLHAYSLMAVGIAVLRMLQVDSKITKARYRQKWSEK